VTLRFRSRIDWWLAALLLAVPADIARRALLATGTPDGDRLMALGVAGAFIGLLVWLGVGTHYTFASDGLVIRSGPLRATIPYDRITRVEHSRSVLAAPALSLRRLMIHYNRADFALVSPADEVGFLAALAERVPGVGLPGVLHQSSRMPAA
jgi:hypothetical protein